jgi:hypothetical protein
MHTIYDTIYIQLNIDRKMCMPYVDHLSMSVYIVFINVKLIYCVLPFSGRVTEPHVCQKEQCKATNSMTLVHNRCR